MLSRLTIPILITGLAACSPVVPSPRAAPDATVQARDDSSGLRFAPPDVAATYVSGRGPKTLAEAKDKIVLVGFWATYSDSGRRFFTKARELADQFGDDLAVITISVDEESFGRAALGRYAGQTPASFSVLWDKDGSARHAFHPTSLPTSYILDKNGAIRFVHERFEAGDDEKMALEIDGLMVRLR